MRWLVMDIGCLECHATSDVVGIYATEKQANDVANILKKIVRLIIGMRAATNSKCSTFLQSAIRSMPQSLEQAKEVTE